MPLSLFLTLSLVKAEVSGVWWVGDRLSGEGRFKEHSSSKTETKNKDVYDTDREEVREQ